jgi:ribosomal protein S18 acetylase RimI-like enzyme
VAIKISVLGVIYLLLNSKDLLDRSDIQELIGYSVFPDPDRLEQVIQQYRSDETLQLFGYESEEEIVGIIGIRVASEGSVRIEHLAVKPECRGAGFGRGQILEMIEMAKPTVIIAETDDEAVDFYRWIGFEVESLGELYPGVERYKCTFKV